MTQRLFVRTPPKPDTSSAGLGFVDVLFGVVVGKTFDFALTNDLSAAGYAHLLLAGLVTVSSWVGYHNSQNRSRFHLRPFTNVPFYQFAVDVVLVGAYYLLAVTVEGRVLAKGQEAVPDVRDETYILAGIFALYLFWDFLAYVMRRSSHYASVAPNATLPARSLVTPVMLLVLLAVAYVAWRVHPDSSTAVISWDVGLGVLVVVYRVSKEWLTPP